MRNTLLVLLVAIIFGLAQFQFAEAQTADPTTATTLNDAQEITIAPTEIVTASDLNVEPTGFWSGFWLRIRATAGKPSSRLEAQRQLLMNQLLKIQEDLDSGKGADFQKHVAEYQTSADKFVKKLDDAKSKSGVAGVETEFENSLATQAALVDQWRIAKHTAEYQEKLLELRTWAIKEIAGILNHEESDEKLLTRLEEFQNQLALKENKLESKFAAKIALAKLIGEDGGVDLQDELEMEMKDETAKLKDDLDDDSTDIDKLSLALDVPTHVRLEVLHELSELELKKDDKSQLDVQIAKEESELAKEVEDSPDAFVAILAKEKNAKIKDSIEKALKKGKSEDLIKAAEKEKEKNEKTSEAAKKLREKSREQNSKLENPSDSSPNSSGSDGTSSNERLELEVKIEDNSFSGLQNLTKGRETRIKVKNEDDASHTFTIDRLGVNLRVEANEEKEVRFTPSVAGTFSVTCTIHGFSSSVTVN